MEFQPEPLPVPVPEAAHETIPGWYRKFRDMYTSAAGICFLLCGDIHGLAARDVSQVVFLQRMLFNKFDIVVYYHRAAGLRFPLDDLFFDDPARGHSSGSMRERAKTLVGASWSAQAGDPLAAALAASGVGGNEDVFAARKPKEALALLERLLYAADAKERVAVIIDGADYLCPPAPKSGMGPDDLDILAMLHLWGRDPTLIAQGNPVFLLSRRLADVHEDLRESGSGYKVLTIDLPDEAARVAYLSWYQQHQLEQNKPLIPLVDLSIADVARMSAGINLHDIEDILLLGAMEGQDAGHAGVTRDLIRAYKDDIITARYSEVATMLDPLPGGLADLGGMEHLIGIIREQIMLPLRQGRRQDVLSRLLLSGPPGTGKTYSVQALAREIGFSALALNLENILDKWIGSSERNLKEFFSFARALAPVLIFLDEADQTDLARRGENSGNPASANLFAAMLRFAGDPALQGRVILVLASNRPDLFDAALLRRMDAVIPVLLPDEAGRQRIIEKQAQTQGMRITAEAMHWLAQRTDAYSANDLSALVREARWHASSRSSHRIELPDAESALANLRPSASRETAEWFTLKAIDACNNLRFCPPAYGDLWRNRAVLRETIKEKEKALPSGPRHARTL